MEPGSGVRKTERDAQKRREGVREPHTEDSFILSQIFLLLLCILFCFPCTETIGLSSNTPLCLPRCHLLSLEWRHATITVAGMDSWQPGPAGFWGGDAGRGFNESEASSPREKCMQMICTEPKEPGWAPAELLLSSEKDERLRLEE